jgi:VCBS repeat-containing protein
MKVERILGGAAHRSHFSSTVMGTSLEGQGTLTFNRETGKWQNVWVDGMSAYQVMTQGTLKEETLVLEGEDRYQGRAYRMRDTTRKVSETELEWTLEMSTDRGATWFTSMQATYRKR